MKNEDLRLKEQEIYPTDEVLKKVLGKNYEVYAKFKDEHKHLELEQVWTYYGHCTKSWLGKGQYKWTTMRGTNKEKTIYWLSVCDGYFNVTVWFLGKNRLEILQSDVSEDTKKLICSAKVFGNKMNTFPVEFKNITIDNLVDIYTLIKYKQKLEAN